MCCQRCLRLKMESSTLSVTGNGDSISLAKRPSGERQALAKMYLAGYVVCTSPSRRFLQPASRWSLAMNLKGISIVALVVISVGAWSTKTIEARSLCYSLADQTCCAHHLEHPLEFCIACDPGGQCCPSQWVTNDPYTERQLGFSSGYTADVDFPVHTGTIACDFYHVQCVGIPPYCQSTSTTSVLS